MSDVIVKATQLAKRFQQGKVQVEVFHDISFALLAKESLAIIGESGAGKSTLLHLLGGLDKPSSGQIELMGQNINLLSEAKKGYLRNQYLGFVYQFHHLLPEFSAEENVAIPLLIRGEKSKVALDKARNYIDKVGLSKRAHHRISELSGGERQRIAIARALVNEPKCVMADEPTGNLDEKTAHNVANLLLNLNETLGIAFIIVTHNKTLAARLHRVMNLENGQLHPIEN